MVPIEGPRRQIVGRAIRTREDRAIVSPFGSGGLRFGGIVRRRPFPWLARDRFRWRCDCGLWPSRGTTREHRDARQDEEWRPRAGHRASEGSASQTERGSRRAAVLEWPQVRSPALHPANATVSAAVTLDQGRARTLAARPFFVHARLLAKRCDGLRRAFVFLVLDAAAGEPEIGESRFHAGGGVDGIQPPDLQRVAVGHGVVVDLHLDLEGGLGGVGRDLRLDEPIVARLTTMHGLADLQLPGDTDLGAPFGVLEHDAE